MNYLFLAIRVTRDPVFRREIFGGNFNRSSSGAQKPEILPGLGFINSSRGFKYFLIPSEISFLIIHSR